MEYRATVKRLMDGQFYARCLAAPNGVAEAWGGTEDDAVERLRNEIRYQLEFCPCSGVDDDYVELDVTEEPERP